MSFFRKYLVLMMMFFFILGFAGCTKKRTVDIKYQESAAIENVQPPIYVKFWGIMADDRLGFQSGSQPYGFGSGDAKYSLGYGSPGDTVILGRRTILYDTFGRPMPAETEEFVRFEVLAYDESTQVVTIRVLPSPKKENI